LYNGTFRKNYVTKYQQLSNYGQQACNIALAGEWLNYSGSMQKPDLLPFHVQLYGDPYTSAGTKLLIKTSSTGLTHSSQAGSRLQVKLMRV
jgi:hypothetical protein